MATKTTTSSSIENNGLFKTIGNSVAKVVDTTTTLVNSGLNIGVSLVGSADIESRKILIESTQDYDHKAFEKALEILKMS